MNLKNISWNLLLPPNLFENVVTLFDMIHRKINVQTNLIYFVDPILFVV